MPTTIDALAIRHRLNRSQWRTPRPFGNGWAFQHRTERLSILVSPDWHDGVDWTHASIAHTDRLPTYDELKTLHAAVFNTGWAYQVFAPPADHVNIHSYALHLFGRTDGTPVLPDFTAGTGSI